MKKVTMQDIADELGISRITVWKVLKSKEGVSDSLCTKIITKAKEMGYHVPDDLKIIKEKTLRPELTTISVAVSRPETSLFWITIIHEIAKEIARYNINLTYTYLPTAVPPDYVLPPMLTDGTKNGIIILNVYDENLLLALSKLPIPKVFMDTVSSIPFSELNGDLILIDGKSCVSEIVDYIIERGRTKIGFIGDIKYAQTNYERYRGFVHSMESHNLSIQSKFCMTGPIGIDTYKEEIDEFLKRITDMPEAFICANDYVASLLYQLLTQQGYRIPEDIAITGFDGNSEFQGSAELTTVQVHNKDIGIRLARQILYRIEHPDACYEITYLRSDVTYRNSTNF